MTETLHKFWPILPSLQELEDHINDSEGYMTPLETRIKIISGLLSKTLDTRIKNVQRNSILLTNKNKHISIIQFLS